MGSTADLIRFLAEPGNKNYAKDVISLASLDYDKSQDLISHHKRNIHVEKIAETNSAILLETILTGEEEELIEPTFVIAGILVRANLPPILSTNQLPDSIIAASQEVSIIAAEPEQFSGALAAIDDIHSKFALEFASGALRSTNQDSFEGELGLTFGTRYFTPSHVCKSESAEKLSDAIDPLGILLKAAGARGKHLQDNMLMRQTTSWSTIEPSRFRVGQVVQLEVAFRVVPAASKSLYRMVLLIRSIALLDSELYTTWERKTRSNKPVIRGRIQFKRSTAYEIQDNSPIAARPSKRARTATGGEVEEVEYEASETAEPEGQESGGDTNMPLAGSTEQSV